MGARRGLGTGRTAVAVVLVATAWGALAGQASGASDPTALGETYLPVHRPVGYLPPEIAGGGSDQSGRQWTSVSLTPLDPVSRPAIEICTEAIAHTPCTRGDEQVRRHVGPVGVSIALTGGSPAARSAAAAYWRTVRLAPGDRLTWPTRG